MAKLSIVLPDAEAKQLRKIAMDGDFKFQPWVRDAVRSLLVTNVNSPAPVPKSHDGKHEALLTLLDQIKQRDRRLAESIEYLIRAAAQGATIDDYARDHTGNARPTPADATRALYSATTGDPESRGDRNQSSPPTPRRTGAKGD